MVSDRQFKFTVKDIDKLKAPMDQKQVMYWDSEVRGLGLLVTKSGSKSFHYYRKVKGNSVAQRKFLGKYAKQLDPKDDPNSRTVTTIEQARADAGELNAKATRGIALAEKAPLDRTPLTLAVAFLQYVDSKLVKKGGQTAVDRETRRFNRLPPQLQTRLLPNISENDAEAIHSSVKKTASESKSSKLRTNEAYRGNYAANRMIQLLRAVFNHAVRRQNLNLPNPFRLTLYEEKPRERYLTDLEVAKLFDALDKFGNEDLNDLIRLSLYMGPRKLEILSILWKNVDLESGMLKIEETKNGSQMQIALGDEEIEILSRRLKTAATEYVFPGDGKSGHLMDPKRSWKTVRDKAGLGDVHIHDLRSTLGTAIAEARFDPKVVSEILNHRDHSTTQKHYKHARAGVQLAARKEVRKRWQPKKDEKVAATAKKKPDNKKKVPAKKPQEATARKKK